MFKVKEINVNTIVDTDPNVYVMRAEDNLIRHNYQEALKEMDKAIEYAPTNKKGRYAFEKIKIFDVIGKHSESIDFITKYLKRLYSELPLYDFYRVLRVLKNNSKYASSILEQNQIPPILLKVYRSGKSSKSFFMQKAEEYLSKCQFDNALAITRLINEKFGEDMGLCLLNGRIFRAEGSYSAAITFYEKAARYQNPQIEVFIEIAEIYEILNETNKAQSWIEKGLDNYPFNPKLLHIKASLHYKSNQYEQCLEVLNIILNKEPKDANAFFLRGLVYDRLKKYHLAKKNFKKAEVIDPDLKVPENPERERFVSRRKRLIIGVILVVYLLLIGGNLYYLKLK